ncbi:hypothetical protein NDU88_004184 [Pleurodeles waltl]|uniref:Uncharacterized protein n=1 Tax=Pleurodeles waltl TaxID=8319 RepID=A0AAV7WTV0_PLEWA|nr:hypothetical protein NDU88_004184 [Pleurodeles waltl]
MCVREESRAAVEAGERWPGLRWGDFYGLHKHEINCSLQIPCSRCHFTAYFMWRRAVELNHPKRSPFRVPHALMFGAPLRMQSNRDAFMHAQRSRSHEAGFRCSVFCCVCVREESRASEVSSS